MLFSGELTRPPITALALSANVFFLEAIEGRLLARRSRRRGPSVGRQSRPL